MATVTTEVTRYNSTIISVMASLETTATVGQCGECALLVAGGVYTTTAGWVVPPWGCGVFSVVIVFAVGSVIGDVVFAAVVTAVVAVATVVVAAAVVAIVAFVVVVSAIDPIIDDVIVAAVVVVPAVVVAAVAVNVAAIVVVAAVVVIVVVISPGFRGSGSRGGGWKGVICPVFPVIIICRVTTVVRSGQLV